MKKNRLFFRTSLLLILAMLWASLVNAQTKGIPAGYYDPAAGLSGDQLKAALHNIIDNHTERSYDFVKTIIKESDEDPNNSNNVILLYTGRSQSKESFGGGANDWNREHVWAKSHGDFGTTPPAGTDAHHLRPTDASVNSSRSNKDFDEGGTQHSEATECYSTNTTWEPRDAVKGDVARMMFYMVVRYEGDASGEPDLELVDYVSGSTTQPIFGVLSTLLKWHQQDPVDDFERNRNEVVYGYQNNRNPFIDHPEYVSAIWNGNAAANISAITHTPAVPTATDNVMVTANITDAEGIYSVTLNWGISAAALTNTIAMNNTSGSAYAASANIPAQANGTSIYYRISVIDSNTVTSLSETINYTIGGGSVVSGILLDEDFETTTANTDISLSDWTTFMETGTRNWISKSYSSNLYAQATSYSSGEANTTWLITPKVNLDLTDSESFSFDINVGYYTHSGFSVYTSTNFNGTDVLAATWTNITSSFTIPTTPTTGYGSLAPAGSYDLSSLSGDIYFAFKYTGNALANQTTTYQIDNVRVAGSVLNTDTEPPVLSFSPVNGALDVPVNQEIIIRANEPLKTANGLLVDKAYLESVLSLNQDSVTGSPVAFGASINAEKNTITIVPASAFKSKLSYFVTVAANSFADQAGNTLSDAKISSFTTAQTNDIFEPEYVSSSLTSNFTNLKFTFNEPIENNLATLDELKSKIQLSTDTITYNALGANDVVSISGNVLQVVFENPLSAVYNRFIIQAEAIKDTAGNAISEEVYSEVFNASVADTIAPHFVAGYPVVSDITTKSLKLTVKLDEPGKVYYKIKPNIEALPTLAELSQGNFINVENETSNYSVVISGLLHNTHYTVYMLTADNLAVPNINKIIDTIGCTSLSIYPALTIQPQSRLTCEGNKILFSVAVAGNDPLRFQWYFNDLPLKDAISDTLIITSAKLEQAGNYYCRVTNYAGFTNSEQASLSFYSSAYAGIDGTIIIADTVTNLNLFSVISGHPQRGGIWKEFTNTQPITNDSIFNVSTAVKGVYIFNYTVTGQCNVDTATAMVSVVDATTVSEKEKSEFKIIPNPNGGSFKLFLNNENSIFIYSIDGKRIAFTMERNNNEALIRLNNFKPGIYLIKVSGEPEMLKFVVE